ncbi:MAG: DUF1501 domain-containing protein [Acidobacteria bacterium]|nr:DUF1501 domain-containing protein [Acidobacteriota bacterium]
MAGFYDTVLTRREMFRVGGVSLGGYYFLPLLQPLQVRAAAKAQPRGTARFCVFVMLDGGQSHVDAWDLKEGKWTPQDFDIRAAPPAGKWPYALYPNLARQLDKVTLMRSAAAWDAVHGRAQYYVQAAHPLNLALSKEIPPMGAIVAMEYQARRRSTDTLPPYVAMNVTQSQAGLLESGFLPARYSPFHINTNTTLSTFSPGPDGKKELERRWELLRRFDDRLRTDPSLAAKAYRDYNDHYQGAVRLLSDPRGERIFRIPEEDKKRYGGSPTGDACILARNLIEADGGTHFLFLQQNGWDHHKDIYSRANHYRLSQELDPALASLIEDLGRMKRPGGRTLLDETLVVCMGEFGRTPGDLTPGLKGRDHYQHCYTVLVAGGGITGGQVIGQTDSTGARIVDPGWSAKRAIYMEDIATTVYSAMGIDWSKSIKTTPSGREFLYVDPLAAQAAVANREVSELFA